MKWTQRISNEKQLDETRSNSEHLYHFSRFRTISSAQVQLHSPGPNSWEMIQVVLI